MRRLIKSFGYAVNGIGYAFKTQPNFRFHCTAILVVLIAGLYFRLELFEWLWILMATALVLVSELFNTAIEVLVDLVSPAYHVKAGLVKDLSAAAVLIAAIIAATIGLIIFIPKFI